MSLNGDKGNHKNGKENGDANSPRARTPDGKQAVPHQKEDIQETFLRAFRELGTMHAACLAVGINRRTVYDWLAKKDFQDRFHDANADVADKLENAAMHRAVTGVTRLVFRNGKPAINPKTGQPYSYQEYSDFLLEKLLVARNPAKYGRRSTEVTVDVNVRILNEFSSEILGILRRMLPDACPHCKTPMSTKSDITQEMERLSSRFQETPT